MKKVNIKYYHLANCGELVKKNLARHKLRQTLVDAKRPLTFGELCGEGRI